MLLGPQHLAVQRGARSALLHRCWAEVWLSVWKEHEDLAGRHTLLRVPTFQVCVQATEQSHVGEASLICIPATSRAELLHQSLLRLTGRQRGPPGLPG